VGHLSRAMTYDEDERGIAYRTRVLRRRSSHSSRGSNAPPGRAGKPPAGRRGTGDRTPKTERYAKCRTPKRYWVSSVNAPDGHRPQPRHRSPESRMPGNRHVRFGGRPHGKGPANPRAPRRAAYPTVRRDCQAHDAVDDAAPAGLGLRDECAGNDAAARRTAPEKAARRQLMWMRIPQPLTSCSPRQVRAATAKAEMRRGPVAGSS
jgi:hypothetical protein